MIKGEWKRLLKNKTLLVVIIAIMAIPTIYTTLFLGSMWDPYGELSNLPVAVVNDDKAVTYNDETLHIGEDLVDNLKENDDLAFNFVDEAAASRGLDNGTYYMVITIPENFSANASTLMDDNPQKMDLKYATNPGTNYIASKMSETALNKIKDKIESQVIEVYSQSMFDNVAEIGDGMEDAADGATELKDGLTDALDGVNSYTDGVIELSSGTKELSSNNDALNDGVKSLSDGVGSLKTGSKQLVKGLYTMSDGIGSTVPAAEDIKALEDGLTNYNLGLKQLNTSLSGFSTSDAGAKIKDSLTGIGANTQDAAGNVKNIAGAAAILGTANLTPEQLEALQTIVSSTNALGVDLSTIGTQTQSVGDNFTAMTSGLSQISDLKTAVNTLSSNADLVLGGSKQAIDGLYNGLGSVKESLDKTVIPGVESLDTGIAAVQSGIDGKDGLKSSIATYTAAVSDINEGVTTLNDKSTDLKNGVSDLESGADELRENLADGAKDVKETVASDATIDMFSSPVDSTETKITDVENNGHAMAAYMMSVALWVACIAFSIMYPLTEYSGELKSGLSWWFSKATILFPIAILQAIFMVFMLNHINGFHPEEMVNTIIVACVASLTFMSILYFFNVCFGKIGSFIMLIFMVVQLAGSAGTYPIELSGAFVSKIHNYLPFSYTVEAFRSTIAGGESIHHAIIILGALCILFNVFTIWVFQFRASRIKKGKPVLAHFLESEGLI